MSKKFGKISGPFGSIPMIIEEVDESTFPSSPKPPTRRHAARREKAFHPFLISFSFFSLIEESGMFTVHFDFLFFLLPYIIFRNEFSGGKQ
jgi:hypothetical protein